MVLISGGGGSSTSTSGSWYRPDPGTSGAQSVWIPSGTSRTTTSSGSSVAGSSVARPSGPLSADAAAVWAGDYQADKATALQRSLEAARRDAIEILDKFGPDAAFIGVDVRSPTWSPVPLGDLAYDPKAHAGGLNTLLYYQIPKYLVDQEWAVGNAMSPDELAAFRDAATRAGLIDPDAVLGSSFGTTDAQVMNFLMQEANRGKAETWQQVLADPLLVRSPSGSVPQEVWPKTRTETTYQKTGLDTGRMILRDMMRSMLGREATDTEVRNYIAALNRMEDSTPEIVKTVQQESGDLTRTIEQLAPDVQETLYGEVEGGNDDEIFTYRANQYMSILERLA